MMMRKMISANTYSHLLRARHCAKLCIGTVCMYVSYNLIASHGLSLHVLSHIYHIHLEIDNIVSIVMMKRETEKST